MKLTSNAFNDNDFIPKKYSYRNENISPPLSWTDVPLKTKTFAIIVDDPDGRDWSHWIIFNIPSNVNSLPKGISKNEYVQGVNDFKNVGYDGPAPPSGTHRYVFHLYALDKELDLKNATKQSLLSAMKGHVLAEAELVGKFKQ